VTLTARALPAWWDGCRYGIVANSSLATAGNDLAGGSVGLAPSEG